MQGAYLFVKPISMSNDQRHSLPFPFPYPNLSLPSLSSQKQSILTLIPLLRRILNRIKTSPNTLPSFALTSRQSLLFTLSLPRWIKLKCITLARKGSGRIGI